MSSLLYCFGPSLFGLEEPGLKVICAGRSEHVDVTLEGIPHLGDLVLQARFILVSGVTKELQINSGSRGVMDLL